MFDVEIDRLRGPLMRHHDLMVRGAQREWKQIRWTLFVFPDIRDVAPTDDPDVVRVYHQGRRAYPRTWSTALAQAGFDADPGWLIGRCMKAARRRHRSAPRPPEAR